MFTSALPVQVLPSGLVTDENILELEALKRALTRPARGSISSMRDNVSMRSMLSSSSFAQR